ncbi:MAG TPA: type II toxin-antitoxin system VapC family toxin [Pirellulaceae bacterium]|nr:type II toxin-antitoxin system VapC family toxin [Pirellulaceae bacterium]
MTLLLDTHTFLWFCQNAPSLSAEAKTLLEDASHRKVVSLASCWEIAIKAGLGKLTLGEPGQLKMWDCEDLAFFRFLCRFTIRA